MVCGYHLSVIRPRAYADGRFIKRFFDSHFARARLGTSANGLTRYGLSQYPLDNVEVPTPPLPEQSAIATFLDRETAKIDALVTEYRTLVELLKEKRQAVISHAVTKGLDPTVPMKDSGVEWLGEVPEHWRVVPLKFLANQSSGGGIQIGPYGSMLTSIRYDEPSSCKVYGQENIINVDFERGNRWIGEGDISSLYGYEVKAGDILFTRKGSIGQCAVVPVAVFPGVIDSDTIRLRLDDDAALDSFIIFGFTAAPYILKPRFKSQKTGAILSGLNSATISSLKFVVPPRPEQTGISDFVGRETAKLDAVVTEAQQAISLLQERRTALISAAVTGKIDVRGLVDRDGAA